MRGRGGCAGCSPKKRPLFRTFNDQKLYKYKINSQLSRMIRSGAAARIHCSILARPPSLYQVAVYLFFILQNYVYETKIAGFLELSISTLVLQIWHYVLIGFIIYEVAVVTGSDTRDPLLQTPQMEDEYDPNDLIYCVMCNAIVLKTSYHCWRCSQCSHSLDHHCKYLNCCIAEVNYFPFLRLLAVFIFYSIDFIYLAYIRNKFNATLWCIIAISAVELFLAIFLFFFHAFLAWCYNGSTLSFYKKGSRKAAPVELREETDIFT